MKKIIIITIAMLILVIFVGFFFFFNNDTGGTDVPLESGFFGNLFSPGRSSGDRTTDNIDGDNRDKPEDDLSQRPISGVFLQKLTNDAIGGAVATSTTLPDTTVENTVIRYVGRATGNIFEVDPTSLAQKRLTNTTIPGVREVIWHGNGEQLIMRYLTDNNIIKSIAGTIGDSFEEGGELIHELEVAFMDDDISYLTSSEAQDRVFYLSQTRDAGVVGLSADFDSSNREVVFESPHAEWIVQWLDEVTALTSKASGLASGSLHFVNEGGDFKKIVGDVVGLTTNTSPDGGMVLYSESAGEALQLYTLDVLNRSIQTLPIVTLPEKCVWSRAEGVLYCAVPSMIESNIYPDVWYQGVVSFSDDIWKIDTHDYTTSILVSPTNEASVEIDVINPFLGPNEEFLFFTNKKDSTLWSLRLNR